MPIVPSGFVTGAFAKVDTIRATWFAWGSLAVFTGLTAILIAARLFGIELFGG